MPSDMGDNLFSRTNRDIARKYWVVVGVIIGVLTAVNIIDRILVRMRLKAAANNHPHPTVVKTRIGQLWATSSAVLREAALPSVRSFTSKNSLLAMFTPLPLGRSLVVFLYMIMIAIMLSYNVYTSGYWYYEKIAYRAAWVSVTQIPFVLLISGRISVFTLLTSIASERINWLHRWVGRVILVSVLVHMSLFWREWDLTDFLQTELEIMPMVRYGFGAFGVLAWIIISSIAPIRWFAYEIFYFNHLASVGALLWCLYMHVPESAIYNVYLGIAFIAFDRLLRTLLFAYNNIHRSHIISPATTKSKYSLHFGHTAEIDILDQKEHLTRVVIKDAKMRWRAGQHIYLSIPSLRPFESHPFSISNAYEAPPAPGKEYKELGDITAPHTGSRDLHLLISSRAGFSKQLHRKCSPAANAPVVLKAFIDGPYGSPPAWNTFETVVLIATSTGITFTLPIIEEIAANPACVRRLNFHWTVRHVSDLKLLTKRLARLANKARGKGVDVLINIAVTCGTMKRTNTAKLLAPSDDGASAGRTSSEISKNSGDRLLKEKEAFADEITPVNPSSTPSCCAGKTLPVETQPQPPSCCSNKSAPQEESQQPPSSEARQTHTRSSSTSSSNSSASSEEDAPCCCAAGDGKNSCCETVCTCGFSTEDIEFSCGRPSIVNMILPPIEAAEGETVVACCSNRRLMDDVRNYVGKVCDDRAVHKGSGAQGVLCWTEGFY
ncbi:hypothetical protein H072_7598 [Dactylellina haptotyla CBS 200.50]|uniref:FAD-binding FR-type domain-containing protein n=1 Tax=Dactylellina haptotyla (strain CBS 200.50) TaxID=1284197 RepID=S8AC12_DACHA|nr:hypothetical protein H072_7598 [Dactylellina haptotyla CBS 200.50]